VVRRHQHGRVRHGLSLPEVLISTAILAIVMAIALPFLLTVERAWSTGSGEEQALDTARAGVIAMAPQARRARRLLRVSAPSDTNGRLLFETTGADGDPHTNEFYYAADSSTGGLGSIRLRDRNLRTGTESDAEFAGPVTGLQFAAFGRDGLTPAADPWRAGLVEAVFQATSADGRASARAVSAIDLPADPPLFAVFSPSADRMDILNNSTIRGDVYCGGDVVLDAGSAVTDGLAYVGGSAFGTSMTVAPGPQPAPSLPPLDTSFYDSLLAQAAAKPVQNYIFSYGGDTVDFASLPDRTFLCNGTVTVNGPVTLTGPGTIVATDDILMSGYSLLTNGIDLVAGDQVSLNKFVDIPGSPFMYARNTITVSKDRGIQANLISNDYIYLSGLTTIRGLVYARNHVGVAARVWGAVYSSHVYLISGARIELDEGLIRSQQVPGLQLW